MSLGIAIKGPEGIVLAADSRITLTAHQKDGPPLSVNYDNATKLLTLGEPHNWVAAVTYGNAIIGQRTAHSFMPEFELELQDGRQSVSTYAQELSRFFARRWHEAYGDAESPADGMTFVVGGYDREKPYGSVFLFTVPYSPRPVEQNADDFGMTFGGQHQIASRIMRGFDEDLFSILLEHLDIADWQIARLQEALQSRLMYTIPFNLLPLQDCVDLGIFLIRTTITAQDLAVGMRGVGGAIEVATITRTDGLKWVQNKEIRGENRP